MNKKKIIRLLVAASTVTGSIVLSNEVVQATPITETYVYSSPETQDVQQGQVVNVTTNLRVRSGASTNSSVIGYLVNGTNVNIKGESGDWYIIQYNSHDGYVSKEYINIKSLSHSIATASYGEKTGKVVNITSNLRVRSGASTSSSVLGYLNNGASVTITGESGNWYAIKYNNTTGYVSKDYISITGGSTSTNTENNSSSSSASSKEGKVINVTTNLRVRSGASTSSSVLGYLNNGTSVTITGESGNWYAIKYNNTTGYVSKDYIQVISNGSNTNSNNTQGSGTTNNNSGNTSATTKTGKVVNVTTNLRVRSGASTSSSVLGYINNGTAVTITGESGNWYAIKYNNTTGYVSKDYIQVTSEGTNTAPSTPPADTNTGSSTTVTNKTGRVVNVTTNLRVRSGASTSSSVLGYINNGTAVTITGESGNWYAIKYNNTTGYVSKDYIQVISEGTNTAPSTPQTPPADTNTGNSTTVTNKIGRVVNVTTNLRVRSAASSSASVLGYLLNGTTVNITGSTNGWYKINYNGRDGYVSSDYIQIVDGSTSSGTGTSQSSKYEIVLSAMKEHIGSPYVWGGSGEYITKSLLDTLSARYPSQAANGAYTRAYGYVGSGMRAFDCSGLMQWGFAQAGIHIGRSTWDQIENGVEVSLNNLQPGDLLFYSSLQHVGMYIGNGQWIESPNKNANVRITSVPWNLIGRARRVL